MISIKGEKTNKTSTKWLVHETVHQRPRHKENDNPHHTRNNSVALCVSASPTGNL